MTQGTRSAARERPPTGATLLTFVGLLMAFLLLAAPHARADTMGFDARPQPGSPDAQLGFFKFDADAGATVQRTLVLTNHSGKAKVVHLAPCDALAAVYGGVAYSESGKTPKQVGSWIELSRESVEVPPNASVEVPFEVAVPPDVTTGIHLGGIAVWEPAAATTSGSGKDGDKATTKITSVTRMVLTVFVTTPGPAVPNLTITGVKAEARPDGMNLLVAITSDGTDAAKGQGTISVPGDGFSQKIDLGDMVPQSTTNYPVKWKADPAEGVQQAQVEINYANGAKVATWSGDFTVSKSDTTALTDRLVPTDKQAGASSTPWLIYGLIGGLVVIVLIMGFALLRRRRPEAR